MLFAQINMFLRKNLTENSNSRFYIKKTEDNILKNKETAYVLPNYFVQDCRVQNVPKPRTEYLTLLILTYHAPLFTLACKCAQVELINAWIKTECIIYIFNWYVNNQTNLFHTYRLFNWYVNNQTKLFHI